jgi:general secretion pathway protein G
MGLWMMTSGATKLDFVRSDRKRRGRGARAGFTLIELLITIGIILTLAGLAVPSLAGAMQTAKVARTVGDIRTIGNASLGFYAQYGAAPNSLADVGWDQQVDAWGHAYQYYSYTTMHGTGIQRVDRLGVPINSFFELYSKGADGVSDPMLTDANSQDDVVWADDGTYIGSALNY